MITRRGFLGMALASTGLGVLSVPRAYASEIARIGFDDLYEREAVLTEKLQASAGREVEMVGFMAPPLKAEAKFFVLTRTPLSVCPFCETEAQWPDDIVLVLTRDTLSALPYNVRIRVRGQLDLGFEKDTETGFVSLIRLQAAEFERA